MSKVELAKVEIKGGTPEELTRSFAEGVEKWRSSLQEIADQALSRTASETNEAVGKVAAELTEAKAQVDGLVKDVVALKRTAELPGDTKESDKLGSLKHVRLTRIREDLLRDSEFGPSMRRMGPGQYDLMQRTADDLGIEDKESRKQLHRMRVLHDYLALRTSADHKDAESALSQGAWEKYPEASEYKALTRRFLNALSEASGSTNEGTEWVPTLVTSGPIIPIVELGLPLRDTVDSWQMDYVSRYRRVKKAHGVYYSLPENVADAGNTNNATLQPKSMQTDRARFTAGKFGTAQIETPEWEQDLIDVNGAQEIVADITYDLDDCEEDCLFNGDASSTLDASYAAPVASTVNALTTVNGIRKMFALTGKTAVDLSAGITSDGLAAIMGMMGPWGFPQECVWAVETAGFARLLVARAADGSPLYLTYMQMGKPGAATTGVLGEVMGSPVLVSKRVPNTLNTSGVIPSPAGTKTALYRIHYSRVSIGRRTGTIVKRSEDARFLNDQIVFKATRRFDIAPLVPGGVNNLSAANALASYPLVGAGFGVATF